MAQLGEILEALTGCRRRAHEHLATVPGILDPLEQVELNESVDDAARGRGGGAETLRDLAHPHLARRGDQIQRLQLGEGEAELDDVRRMQPGDGGVEAIEGRDDAADRSFIR